MGRSRGGAFVAALLSAVLLPSCGSGAGTADTDMPASSELPPPGARLVELTPDQALSLCEWQSALLHAGFCRQNALIASRSGQDCAAYLTACTAPDRVATEILTCAQTTRDPARACDHTVAEVQACARDVERQYAAQPTCQTLTDENFRDVLYRMSPPSCERLECPP